MDRHDVGSSEQVFLVDQGCASSTRGFLREFWLQASTSMPNATPMRATSFPMLPKPTTPRVLPRRLGPEPE